MFLCMQYCSLLIWMVGMINFAFVQNLSLVSWIFPCVLCMCGTCAQMCRHTCIQIGIYMWAYVWRPEVRVRCLPESLLLLFSWCLDTVVFHRTWRSLIHLDWLRSQLHGCFWPSLTTPHPQQYWSYRHKLFHPGFYINAGA